MSSLFKEPIDAHIGAFYGKDQKAKGKLRRRFKVSTNNQSICYL
jgi:hypothetical protein